MTEYVMLVFAVFLVFNSMMLTFNLNRESSTLRDIAIIVHTVGITSQVLFMYVVGIELR